MKVYRDSATKSGVSPSEQGVPNAKNRKQVENQRYQVNKDMKISHDSAYNMLEMEYNLDNFVV